jgi:hypothetical protein
MKRKDRESSSSAMAPNTVRAFFPRAVGRSVRPVPDGAEGTTLAQQAVGFRNRGGFELDLGDETAEEKARITWI